MFLIKKNHILIRSKGVTRKPLNIQYTKKVQVIPLIGGCAIGHLETFNTFFVRKVLHFK